MPAECVKKTHIYVQYTHIIHRETLTPLPTAYLATTGRDCFVFDATASAAFASFSDLSFRR